MKHCLPKEYAAQRRLLEHTQLFTDNTYEEVMQTVYEVRFGRTAGKTLYYCPAIPIHEMEQLYRALGRDFFDYVEMHYRFHLPSASNSHYFDYSAFNFPTRIEPKFSFAAPQNIKHGFETIDLF
jgi:hypothetical protein